MITLHDIEQGTIEWKELRADLYTGSGADKLLKHSGKIKIIDGVASAYALAEITGFKGNYFTKRGHLLEDEAIDLYQAIKREIGIRLESGRKVGFVTNSMFPNCGYSPDDIYPDRTIECKAFNVEKHMQMINGDIPLKVLAQCYFGMLICGKKLCHLILYNPEVEDPKQSFVIIEIKWKASIANNFKRILLPKQVAA